MKILVMGADGFIGNRLRQEMKEAFFSNAKIYSLTDAEREIEKYKPDILINCIGYTGSNVEDCELNKEKTLMCNTFIPLILYSNNGILTLFPAPVKSTRNAKLEVRSCRVALF